LPVPSPTELGYHQEVGRGFLTEAIRFIKKSVGGLAFAKMIGVRNTDPEFV
jgi:hypothetical protein